MPKLSEKNLPRRCQPGPGVQKHEHLLPIALHIPFGFPQEGDSLHDPIGIGYRMPQCEDSHHQSDREQEQQRHRQFGQRFDTA